MIQFSAIDLQDLLVIYDRDLLPYEFIYQTEDGRTIRLTFEQSQLGHLLGIQKVDQSRSDLKGQKCYDGIKQGLLTFSKLKSINRHAVATECKDKIRYFDELPAMLANPECIMYDGRMATKSRCIKMSFALYGRDGNAGHRLILGIDHDTMKDENIDMDFFPRTWLIEKLNKPSVLDGQVKIKIIGAVKRERKNKC